MNYKVGDTVTHKLYGVITLIEMLPKGKCIVEFESGFRREVVRGTFRNGRIRDLYFPSVLGIGVIGDKYKAHIGGKITSEYMHWAGMLHRCYSGRANVGKSYTNKTVSEDWFFLTNFGDWCQAQIGFGNKGWNLDKDLLLKGNTEYSADSCVFLPQAINNALPRNMGNNLILPNCVGLMESGRYQVPAGNKTRVFDTLEEAKSFYENSRKDRLKSLAVKYKDVIDPRAYIALESIFT